MIAEKLFDSKDESLFIYQIDLDNGIRLIFDANKEFIHQESTDEFAYVEEEILALDSLPNEVSSVPQNSNPDYTITEVIKEFAYDADPILTKRHLFTKPSLKRLRKTRSGVRPEWFNFTNRCYRESEFEQNQWKPVELTQLATEYLATNYKDGDFPIGYFVEERPDPSGQGKELVAFLDNGVEVIFDELGNFTREMDPWKAFEENLDAGLKFDSSRSSWGDDRSEFGTSGSYVHIEKVEDNVEQDENSEMDYFPMQQGMLYRISLLNQERMKVLHLALINSTIKQQLSLRNKG